MSDRGEFEKAYNSGDIHKISRDSEIVFEDFYKHVAWAAWQAARATDAEPVGFMYRHDEQNEWSVEIGQLPFVVSEHKGWQVKPLYTTPPTNWAGGVPDEWKSTLHHLLQYAWKQTCPHEETHRAGAIWEVCDHCGAKWADDEGGMPEFVTHPELEAAEKLLSTTPGNGEWVRPEQIIQELQVAQERIKVQNEKLDGSDHTADVSKMVEQNKEDALDCALSGQNQRDRLIDSVSAILCGQAYDLMLSHTVSGEWPEREQATKAEHDMLLAMARELRDLKALPAENIGTIGYVEQAARSESAEAVGCQWLIQMRGDYLVTRGVWERPDHRGYTNDINEAGRYSEAQAKEAERMMPEKCKAVRLPPTTGAGGVPEGWKIWRDEDGHICIDSPKDAHVCWKWDENLAASHPMNMLADLGEALLSTTTPGNGEWVRPDAYAVVEDDGRIGCTVMVDVEGVPKERQEDVARQFCHDHISDACSAGIEGAGSWVVRPLVIGRSKRPQPPVQGGE